MPYGTVKVDNVTFTNNSVDATTTFSGIYASITDNLTLSGTATATTFTGTTANFTNVNAQNIGVTTSLSGLAITGGTAGFTTITGTTVTGTTANFVTVSGTTVTGNTGRFTNLAGAAAGFTTVTGTTVTGTTANFVSGVFTTRISGTTVTGTTASFTSGVFASLSGTTHTITSGVFASGTAALPSISFVSDPNTGIYSPGADQVAVATNGVERLFIGNTGGEVHTGSPNWNFASSAIRRTASNTANTKLISFLLDGDTQNDTNLYNNVNFVVRTDSAPTTGSTSVALNAGLEITSPATLRFGTNGSERLRITSAGLVGIGTSSPDELLHIKGDTPKLRIESSNTLEASAGTEEIGRIEWEGFKTSNFTVAASIRARQDGTWSALTQWNAPAALEFYTQDNTGVEVTTPRMLINSSGKVGIGTTTPQKRLDIYDGASNFWFRDNGVNSEIAVVAEAGGLSALYFGDAADDIRGAVAYNSTDDSLQLRGYNNTERARIDSSGRLLVGTSSAAAGFGNLQSHTTGAFAGFYGNFANDVNPVVLTLGKSRGNDFSTIVQSGDGVGSLRFNATDGTGNLIRAAQINCEVDGTPGTNDMPGRLVFSTTADGAASPTEAMRISNDRSITVSDGGHVVLGTTTGTKIGTATTQKIGFYNTTPVVQPTAVANATDAASVITQLNALLAKLRTLGIIAT